VTLRGGIWVATVALAALVFGVLGQGCQERDAEQGMPAWAVQKLVERMSVVHGDRERSKAAYELLWSRAKENLKERAVRASALLGRVVEPEELLVPSHFSLEFVPKEYTTEYHGDWAVVTARTGSLQREIKCVQEPEGWRVVVDLPPLRPIEERRDPPPSAPPRSAGK
jgi:hypothetical protein